MIAGEEGLGEEGFGLDIEDGETLSMSMELIIEELPTVLDIFTFILRILCIIRNATRISIEETNNKRQIFQKLILIDKFIKEE